MILYGAFEMPRMKDPIQKLTLLALTTACVLFVPKTSCPAQTVDDQYALAAGYYSRGQWGEAEEAFRAVIARFPNSDQAYASHFFLGESLVQLQRYADAYAEYQAFLACLPNHRLTPRAKFRMGECAYRMQRYAQAAGLLEYFGRTYPNHELQEFALPYLGQVRLLLQEPQLAQRVFESSLRLYPQSTMSNQCRFGLANALQAQGDYAEALRFYQFIAAQPGNELAGNAYKQIGIMDFAQGYYENARSNLKEAKDRLARPEDLTETTYWLARTDMELGNFERALELYTSIAEDPADQTLGAAILFDGAVVATKINNAALATRWLSRLRKKWPESQWAQDALRMQIDTAYRDGNLDQALVWIGQFTGEYPDSKALPVILELEGRIHYQQKDFQATIGSFQKLLEKFVDINESELRNQIPRWRYFVGLGYIGLGEFQKAHDQLELVDDSNDDSSFNASVAIAHASALMGLGRNEQATVALRKYLSISPDGKQAPQARSDLAIACVKSGQWGPADVVMKELHRNYDGQILVLETAQFLAESAFKAAQYQYAASWFEMMAEPGNPTQYVTRGLSGLAWSCMENNQSEKALETFHRLLNQYPESEYAADAATACGKFLEDHAKYREAADMYGQVYTRFGDSNLADVARLRRAYNLQRLGDAASLTEAETLLTDYLKTTKDVPAKDEALYQLAWVHMDLNHPELGQKRFEQLSNDYPESRFWADATYRVAENYVNENEFEKAEWAIEKLLDADAPSEIFARALFLKGQIAAKNKDWLVVGDSMTSLLNETNDPSMSAKANYWLAESLFQRGEFVDAGEIFGRLADDQDPVTQQLSPWIHLRNAQCLAYNEKWMTALSAAELGKEKFPGFDADYEFDFVRGRALAAVGRLEDARAAYESVIASSRGGSTETAAIAQWRIGETFFHQENYKQAIAAYYKVDSLFSYKQWRAAALIQAGKCQEHLGNWKQAAKLYQQLIEQFPDSQYRDDAEKRMKVVTQQAKLKQNPTR